MGSVATSSSTFPPNISRFFPLLRNLAFSALPIDEADLTTIPDDLWQRQMQYLAEWVSLWKERPEALSSKLDSAKQRYRDPTKWQVSESTIKEKLRSIAQVAKWAIDPNSDAGPSTERQPLLPINEVMFERKLYQRNPVLSIRDQTLQRALYSDCFTVVKICYTVLLKKCPEWCNEGILEDSPTTNHITCISYLNTEEEMQPFFERAHAVDKIFAKQVMIGALQRRSYVNLQTVQSILQSCRWSVEEMRMFALLTFPSQALSIILQALFNAKTRDKKNIIKEISQTLLTRFFSYDRETMAFYSPGVLQILNFPGWKANNPFLAKTAFDFLGHKNLSAVDDAVLKALCEKISFQATPQITRKIFSKTLSKAWLVIRRRPALVKFFQDKFSYYITSEQIVEELNRRDKDFEDLFIIIMRENNESLASSRLDLLSEEEQNTFFSKTLVEIACSITLFFTCTGMTFGHFSCSLLSIKLSLLWSPTMTENVNKDSISLTFIPATLNTNTFVILRNLYKQYAIQISWPDVELRFGSIHKYIAHFGDVRTHSRHESVEAWVPLFVRLFEHLLSWVTSDDTETNSVKTFQMEIEQIIRSYRTQEAASLLEGPKYYSEQKIVPFKIPYLHV